MEADDVEADDVEATTSCFTTTSGFCCTSGVFFTSGVCCLGGVSTSIVATTTCGFGDDCWAFKIFFWDNPNECVGNLIDVKSHTLWPVNDVTEGSTHKSPTGDSYKVSPFGVNSQSLTGNYGSSNSTKLSWTEIWTILASFLNHPGVLGASFCDIINGS